MPLNKNLKKVMVIGSGPIVIGQAAEFDYAGTQACRALKEAGLEVVLVNSNPATIMTDNHMADKIYIEALNLETVKRIIEKEKPDSLLSTLGGQTGLTLSMQLAKEGFLASHGVTLLGANPETIDKAEDRKLFKETMEKIGEPCIPSEIVTDVESALTFAHKIGYPVIIRPAFTLGGTGGGIVSNDSELCEICGNGLRLSPITQVLVEKCISGWKEIEFEVMRDSLGNVITVCSMENFDPVGIHTGDSIVAAPALTLSDKEYQMLRSAALNIISELKVEGGCNCQFALKPDSFDYAVIEVNPRVSRSSALASKATGYPIAKVAAKIAIGYTLDEIKNDVTGKTCACFEPALDYVVVKFPKWPFDKFVYAKRTLGTQMKATGEVMAIGGSFEEALMKAVRGAELSLETPTVKAFADMSIDEIIKHIGECTDERLFFIYEAMKREVSLEKIHEITKIDMWFLHKVKKLCDFEKSLINAEISGEKYLAAKKMGFLDKTIESLSGKPLKKKLYASYKTVDTCAAEFSAETPYFYSTYDSSADSAENEAKAFIESKKNRKKTVIVFGSGPIRIGQGIEFDYACVHCVWSLKKLGYEVVIVNNNPETVSTDFDTADRLYFEPLNIEDVMSIIHTEKPYGAVVAFGGQTAIKLTAKLAAAGVKILGTSADSIDAAEDRKRFDALLEKLEIKRPEGRTVFTEDEAVKVAKEIGYPVLIRPSYVLGGQNMIIAFTEDDIHEYMKIVLTHTEKNPILIDKYLSGTELEVDAICDGHDILIPGIMEHIERAGIHSGDSIAVYPAWNVSDAMKERIIDCSRRLALSLGTKGLINIQYLIYNEELYVIEVNPRSSRTVPYISKVTHVPMVDLAVQVSVGNESDPEKTASLADLGYGTGLYKTSPYYCAKVPVFSFAKLLDVDNQLGPEMKSTGEVLGIANTLEEALYKGISAAGYKLKKSGGVLFTVRDIDKDEMADVAAKFHRLGFRLYATPGTAARFAASELPVTVCGKVGDTSHKSESELIDEGVIDYVVSTSSKGRNPTKESVRLRRKAIERSIPCLTSVDTANALADSLLSRYSSASVEIVDINHMRSEKLRRSFTKMTDCANDYIYFDVSGLPIDNPEGLSVRLSDRHNGIGGDGVVLIGKSETADAAMRMFNKDGSEGKMAGNAIRCVAKYLYDNGIVTKTDMTVETASGIKNLHLTLRNGKTATVRVDMGKVSFKPSEIPVNLKGDEVVGEKISVGGYDCEITCVSVGNPHAVIFFGENESVEKFDVCGKGSAIENYTDIFPERTNVEFCRVINEKTLLLRVWERGNGETLACGTGACAAAAAAVKRGLCPYDTDISVHLPGGKLTVKCACDGTVYLTGSPEALFTGEVEI